MFQVLPDGHCFICGKDYKGFFKDHLGSQTIEQHHSNKEKIILANINRYTRQKKLEKFLKESNDIEGESWDQLPMEAAKFALAHVHKNIHPLDICKIHLLLGEDMRKQNNIHLGEFRKCSVHVGKWIAPSPKEIVSMMDDYCAKWAEKDSWTAHNEFEAIHPFEDGNGRVGRLLWLIKAIEEGYDYSIPFLHKYYYQTLSKQNVC